MWNPILDCSGGALSEIFGVCKKPSTACGEQGHPSPVQEGTDPVGSLKETEFNAPTSPGGTLNSFLLQLLGLKQISKPAQPWLSRWGSSHPWKCPKNLWMWHLGTQVGGAGLDDPQGFFQPLFPLAASQFIAANYFIIPTLLPQIILLFPTLLPQIPSLCLQLLNPAANGLGKCQEWEGDLILGEGRKQQPHKLPELVKSPFSAFAPTGTSLPWEFEMLKLLLCA